MACPAPFAKIFLFRPEANQFTDSHRPVPQRGVRTSRTRGRMRWTRKRARRTRPAGVRRSRVVLTPQCWRQVCDKKRRRRCQTSLVTGESTKEAVKPLRREGRTDSGGPVVTTLVCFVLFRTRGRGCIGHPAFPAPSVFLGQMDFVKARAHHAAGPRMLVLRRCLKVESEILREGEALADAAHVFRSPRSACLEKREMVDRRCRLNPTSSRARSNANKSPARRGRPGEALVSGRSRASKCAGARTIVQAD